DGWRRLFGVELSPEDLGPWYEDVEATLGVAPVPWEAIGGNGQTIHRGAEALGIAGRPLDRNGAGCRGSGVCTAGCPVDGKPGVHLNYLPQAVEAGATLFQGAAGLPSAVRPGAGGRGAGGGGRSSGAAGGDVHDP